MSNPWKKYHSLTKDKAPRSLVVRALKYISNKDACLDIGAGALNDTKFLLRQGFKKVIAIDSSPDFLASAKEITSKNFLPIGSPIESYPFIPRQFDFITAQFSLPFVNSKEDLNNVWDAIYNSLKGKGIFCGQLFGEKDSWNDRKQKILFHSRKEVEAMIKPYEVLFLKEEEKDGETASGHEKHWHVFNFILAKE